MLHHVTILDPSRARQRDALGHAERTPSRTGPGLHANRCLQHHGSSRSTAHCRIAPWY